MIAKLLQLVVTIALFALIFSQLKFSAVVQTLAALSGPAVTAAVALAVLQIVVLAWRWYRILLALEVDVSFREACSALWVGLFFNHALPSSVGGDAVRVWIFRNKVGWRGAVSGVLIDRVSGLLGLLVLMAIFQPWLLLELESNIDLGLLAAFALACIATAAFFAFDRISPLLGPLRRLSLMEKLRALSRQARSAVWSPHTIVPVVGLAVVVQACAPLMVYVLGLGASAGLSLVAAMSLVPAVGLTIMLPISFGGWGLREGAMVALLSAVGVEAEIALALSLAYGLALLAASLPGGLLWLALKKDSGEPSQAPTG